MSGVPGGIWCVLSALEPEVWRSRGAAALSAGARALTLRLPCAEPGDAVRAWRAPELATAWRAVHAHGDWAAASQSQAVIAGARGLSVADLHHAFPQLTVGASVHSLEEARAACSEGASFLLFGPVWETPSKAGVLDPRGLDALASVCALGVPVIAIGGILAAAQARAVQAAGAHACAVLRAAADPEVVRALVAAWNETRA